MSSQVGQHGMAASLGGGRPTQPATCSAAAEPEANPSMGHARQIQLPSKLAVQRRSNYVLPYTGTVNLSQSGVFLGT
jgi:hypothetical protein